MLRAHCVRARTNLMQPTHAGSPIGSFPMQALAEASAALHHQHLAAQGQLVGGGGGVLPGGIPTVLSGGVPTILSGGGVSTVLSGGGVPTVLSGGGVPMVLPGGIPTVLSNSGGGIIPGGIPGVSLAGSLPGSLPGVLPGMLPHALPTSVHPLLAAQVSLPSMPVHLVGRFSLVGCLLLLRPSEAGQIWGWPMCTCVA